MAKQELPSKGVSAAGQGGHGILRAAGLMGAATFLSRILGLVREQAFAILFGAGNAMDAYLVAFRIPNLLRDLFAEGAMSASLVPTFTRARAEEGERRAWRVAGLVFRVLFVFVALLAAVGTLFAPELVQLYASAYQSVPGKFDLTVRMTRIMFPFFPLVALAAAFMGVLNACGVFFMPALSSALFNVTSIVVGTACAAILFRIGPDYGIHPIEGMALGVVIGGLVQALCQLPGLYRKGYRWQPRAAGDPKWHQDPYLRKMLWMMAPGTVGLAATQVNFLVNTILATSQGAGAVSWLSYSFRLMQFPIGVFGVSLAAATLPRVSQLWVEKNPRGVSRTLEQSLRHVFAINLPASAGLAFLGVPILQLIFQYGRFHADDTAASALALAMYSIGLTAYSAVKVLVPACYALGNTRVPVLSSILTVFVTIALNLAMIRPFGYWGLALGTSVGAIFNAGFLLLSLRNKLGEAGGDLKLAPLARSFASNLLVALLMGVACYGSWKALDHWIGDAFMLELLQGWSGKAALIAGRMFRVALLVAEGAGLAILLAHLFKLRDTVEAFEYFTKKLKKKLSRR